MQISDASQRQRALDPYGSFIVQAPAGSGKTELLTQRYLRLLANVDYPEEIAAITFTRKAAAEMRSRVLSALDSAQHPCPLEAHKQTTWELAQAVSKHDTEQGWSLRDNPNRLRIQTFDSLAAELTRQMPMVAEIGAPPSVQDSPDTLYREAAQATLGLLDDPDLGPHLARILRHLNNRLGQVEELICAMLSRRDQWLGHFLGAQHIEHLEAALRQAIEQRLAQLETLFPDHLLMELMQLATWAADNLPPAKAHQPVAIWAEAKQRPGSQWEDLSLWAGLANLALANTGTVRKRLDKNIGFPAPGEKGLDATAKALRQTRKQQMTDLLGELAEHPQMLEQLAQVSSLPQQGFSDAQAELIESLLHCLVNAAGQLRLVFQDSGEVDFAEVQQRALQALGSEDAPTDLALSLDYRLKHLLVDEFQDTSHGQMRLLHMLTAGWQPGDGRSLLLVGDPMQSIYRFRKAEVGLYLQTREHGLGQLSLEPLTLEMNFRSQAAIVDWVNHAFQQLFPEQGNASLGAVPYAESVPAQPLSEPTAVRLHGYAGRDDEREAQDMTRLINDTLTMHPEQDIAVLARGRSHLKALASTLQTAGIRFTAVDIDPLAGRPVVQDLRSLTRALLHPADRLAWLSVLRAPWLGVDVKDLLRLAEHSDKVLLKRLSNPSLVATLSQDGQARIHRLLTLISSEVPSRGRLTLRSWVEGIWLALGGMAICDDAAQADAQAFFALLEKLDESGELDFQQLDQRLQKLYASADTQSDGRVQIMTMHAAKGLEFDTVILPGLGRLPRNSSTDLLYWQEIPQANGDTQLLMAPIKAHTASAEPISDFIRAIDKEKDQLETIRLLYVAATRAKQRLHLFGHVNLDKNGEAAKQPSGNSLLSKLWPVVEQTFDPVICDNSNTSVQNLQFNEQRLAADWQLAMGSQTETPADHQPEQGNAPDNIDYSWAGDTARHVGTLVHRYLERIANEGLDNWPVTRIDSLEGALGAALAHLGVDNDNLSSAIDKCSRALKQCLNDDLGRWILSPHPQHHCELPVTLHDGQSRHYIIDRTFIDEEGTRWVIDYKTSEPIAEESIEQFLQREHNHYRDQLENYGHILQLLEQRPIKLALYFPLLGEMVKW